MGNLLSSAQPSAAAAGLVPPGASSCAGTQPAPEGPSADETNALHEQNKTIKKADSENTTLSADESGESPGEHDDAASTTASRTMSSNTEDPARDLNQLGPIQPSDSSPQPMEIECERDSDTISDSISVPAQADGDAFIIAGQSVPRDALVVLRCLGRGDTSVVNEVACPVSILPSENPAPARPCSLMPNFKGRRDLPLAIEHRPNLCIEVDEQNRDARPRRQRRVHWRPSKFSSPSLSSTLFIRAKKLLKLFFLLRVVLGDFGGCEHRSARAARACRLPICSKSYWPH